MSTETHVKAKSGKRQVWLDVLRFAAIVLVLGAHMDECGPGVHPWVKSVADVWRCGGWTGVDLFFVLSGFLVSGLIFSEQARTGTVHLGRFLIRRGFKIYPAFWVVIAFTIFYRLRNYGGWLTPEKIVGELIFLQNYVGRMWNTHWSLAVEEHFYLLLALGVALSLKLARNKHQQPFRRLPVVFVVVALFCFSVRWYNGTHYAFDMDRHLMPTHARIDSLFFGVLISWALHNRLWTGVGWGAARRWLLVLAGCALYVPAFVFPFADVWWVLVFGVVAFYVGGGLLVMAGHGITTPWPAPFRLAALIGEHSYSIYLWHIPFKMWINPRITRLLHIQDVWWLSTACYLIGSIIVGCLMAKIIERPILLLRDKWFPARSKVPAEGSTATAAVPVVV